MAAEMIEVSALNRFKFVNTCWCKAVHSIKQRGAVQVDAEQALDKAGNLKAKFEILKDEDGGEIGYALRGDSPVYEHAEEVLKDGVSRAREALDEIVFKIEGGAMVLPSDNYSRWDEVVAQISAIQEETNDALNGLRVDESDPGSPLINDLLRERKKGKAMAMDWTPLLHPELVVSDDNGQETIVALCRSALDQVKDLALAVERKDTVQIGRLLVGLRNAEKLFTDETTRGQVKAVIANAKQVKETSETDAHGRRMAERATDPERKAAHMNKTADAVKARVKARAGLGENVRGLTHTITFTSEDLRKAGDLGKAMRKRGA